MIIIRYTPQFLFGCRIPEKTKAKKLKRHTTKDTQISTQQKPFFNHCLYMPGRTDSTSCSVLFKNEQMIIMTKTTNSTVELK